MDLLFIYSGEFGERVIGNLINFDKFCTVCDPACSSCRFGEFNWSSEIKQAMIAPGPDDLQPGQDSGFGLDEPQAEIAFLIDIHPDVMLEFCESLGDSEVRAVIIPVDRPGIGPGFIRQVSSMLGDYGIELAAPKPSCSLDPDNCPPRVREFIARYSIGKPSVQVETDVTGSGDAIISKARVKRSAPCGATWYICRRLVGTTVDADLMAEVISRAHHTYPCTASMSIDRELGDTFLHEAGCIARDTVFEAVVDELARKGMEVEARTIAEWKPSGKGD